MIPPNRLRSTQNESRSTTDCVIAVVNFNEQQEAILKQRHVIRYVIAGFILAMPAVQGATVPDEVKAVNTDVCMKLPEKIDKYAPADKSKRPAYCACVSETYWSSIPQVEYDGMSLEYQAGNYDGPRAKSLNDHVDERLLAAEKKCSG